MENYEEKYKQALERAKSIYNTDKITGLEVRTCEQIFPELCESQDEKIRKGLIKGLSAMRDIHKHQTFSDDAINIDDAIAWLEKQGEKKPADSYCQKNCKGFQETGKCFADGECKAKIEAEQNHTWSEEDEKMVFGLVSIVEDWYNNQSEEEKEYYGDCGYVNFLESLKGRVQPKQEWGEYDKIQLSEAIQMIEANGTWIRSEDAVKKVSNWLKSLKPNRWKPSDEQMEALNDVRHLNPGLVSLYWKLKKS